MSILVIILVLLAVVAGGVYLQVDPRYTSYDLQANIPPRFGIPPWLKRELEEKALDTLGENKASYLTKSYVEKIPASDQKDVKELKTGVGNAAGGALQNPLGKFVCCALAFLVKPTLLTFLPLGWQYRGRCYQASYWSLRLFDVSASSIFSGHLTRAYCRMIMSYQASVLLLHDTITIV